MVQYVICVNNFALGLLKIVSSHNQEDQISARQEVKRRGSWPVAYSNDIYKRYNKKAELWYTSLKL